MTAILRLSREAPRWVGSWTRSLSQAPREGVRDYDIVIVGAGMVGAALAASLSANPLTSALRVALLDAKVPPKGEMGEVPEMRVSTLTPSTVQLLEKCGAWEALAPPHSAPVEHMQVWDYGSGGYLRWSARQVGCANMGYVAENSKIQAALLETLHPGSMVDSLFPVSIQSITFPSHTAHNAIATVDLDSGEQLRARLVVGADGASSRVRQLAGLEPSAKDYCQRGLVATVEVSEPNATAWQRFLPTGPFALLPVRNGFFNIVWSTTEEMARAVETADEAAAVQAFNEALYGGSSPSISSHTSDLDAFRQPPQITKIAGGMPKSFPLKRQLADTFVGSRLALVGDAYRVVHPLAGQGVNLGFGDVLQLQRAIEDAIQSGQDIGDPSILTVYLLHSFHPDWIFCRGDTIRELFGIQALPFQSARGLGLDTLNSLKSVKNEIMLYAMGLKSASAHLPFGL